MDIQKELFRLQDLDYKAFHSKLMPTVSSNAVIGVRVPVLRKLAKQLIHLGEEERFLNSLPHQYYEENNLHAFIISEIKEYEVLIRELNRFLPYVDNWATCDGIRPKIFCAHKGKLILEIEQWMASHEEYTVRFGLEMLMLHYLENDFRISYLEKAADIKLEKYYVNMMLAWLFATSLAKQYESTLPFLCERRLSDWVHRKTIQKAIESYRITKQQKAFLITLK